MNQRDETSRNALIVECLNATAIISESDIHGNITHVNPLFEKISGYSLTELIGKNHNILNSGHHSDVFFKNMWKDIKAGLIWQGEILNKKKNGEHYWVDSTIFGVRDASGDLTGYMSIRYDITDKIRMKEAELSQYRLKSIGESAAQTMHDIMNPLTIIQHGLKIVRRQLEAGKPEEILEIPKKILKMESASSRIGCIVRNMQMFMHGSHEKVAINLIDEIMMSHEYLVDKLQLKNVDFSSNFEGTKEEFKILGNALQIQQVVINLVSNAIDAVEEHEVRWIKIDVKKIDELIIMSVIDSGQGIDPKIKNKMFDSLFSTKEVFKGTGLGLGICKKIVESFGGNIKINDQAANTTFDVEFQAIS